MFLGHSLKELDISIDLIIQLTNPHQIKGQSSLSIKRIASLREAQAGDLSFLGNKKYQNQVGDSQASVILLPLDVDFQPRPNQVLLFVPHPSEALSSVCQAIEKNFLISPVQPGIHPSSCIDPTAHIDPTATIGPYCFVGPHSHIGPHSVLVSHIHIGSHVEIGSSAYLMPQVTVLDYCVLGDRVRLHSGVVIGSDGFGYTTINGLHQKQPQIGIVVVEDDVEIGAHTTIDRARFSETCIGCGTKIDNLVQIAHNVQIGAHSIIVAQVGIAGSTQLGQQVVVGGQAGIAGHLTIGDQCMIGAQTGLNHDLDPKSYVRGTPAYPIAHAMRLDVLHKKLPDLYKKVSTLEEKMKSMQEPSSPHEQGVYGSNQ